MSKVKFNEIVSSLKSECESCPFLKMNFSNINQIDIITNSQGLFLENLFKNTSFSFVNFFDTNTSLNDGVIKFNQIEIQKKAKYNINEIEELLKTQPLKYNELTTTLLSNQQSLQLTSLLNQDDVFLTFLNLYYQKKDSKTIYSTPLLFFKVKLFFKDNSINLSLDYNTYLFNSLIINQLKRDYNIDLTYSKYTFNLEEYILETQKKISNFHFGIDCVFSLIKFDVFKYLKLDTVLEYFDSNYHTSNDVFLHLNNEFTPTNLTYNSKSTQLDFVQQAINQLQNHSIIQVDKLDKFSTRFIKETINEHIFKKQNVLFITPSKNKEDELRKMLIQNYYDGFFLPVHVYDPNFSIFSLIKNSKNKTNYILDSNLIYQKQEVSELNDEFQHLSSELCQIGTSLQEDDFEIFTHYYSNACLANQIFEFRTDQEYSFNNYLTDLDFLKFLSENKYYDTHGILNNKYHLISNLLNDYEYDDFIKFIKQTLQEFNIFYQLLDQSHIKESNFSNFTSINQVLKIIKEINIFTDFNFFNLDYFNFDFSKQNLDYSNQLKDCYRTHASIHLTLDMVCNQDVWKLNFQDVLNSLKDKKAEKETRKMFRNIIKISPFNKTYKSVLILLDKYIKNEELTNQLKEKLYPYFKDECLSLDGLLNLDKIAKYIDSYKQFQANHPDYDFHSDFTKQVFTNKSYFEEIKLGIENLQKQFQKIQENLNKLLIILPNDSFNYLNSSFEEINKHLNNYLTGTKEEFITALTFNKLYNKTSYFIKQAIQQSPAENLNNFSINFQTSINQYVLLDNFNRIGGIKTLETANSILNEFYTKNNSVIENLDLDLINFFNKAKDQLINLPSFNQTLSQLKREYQNGQIYSLFRSIDVSGHLLYHLNPIEIINIYSAIYLKNYKFNLAIVDLEQISLEDLLFSFLLADKVILIGNLTHQIENCIPHFQASLSTDLSIYTYSLPKEVLNRIINCFNRHNIKLELNKKIDDFTIGYYFEVNNNKFALKVETSKDILTFKNCNLIPSFLYNNYQIKTKYLYLIPFIIYEDLSVLLLYNEIDFNKNQELVEKKKYDSLTYEQKRRVDYFSMLDKISQSFKEYSPNQEEKITKIIPLRRSNLKLRAVETIPYLEIAGGILTFLSKFSYLNKQTLLKRIALVIGTTEKDINYNILFNKACSFLEEENLIEAKENRLYLKRQSNI